MNKSSLPAAVGVLVLVLAACVFAGTAPTDSLHLTGKRFIGTVVAADTATNTLVVRSWKGETVFDAANARFAGQDSLKSIESGDRVFIRYVEKGDTKSAISIAKAPVRHESEKKAGSDVQVAKPDDSFAPQRRAFPWAGDRAGK